MRAFNAAFSASDGAALTPVGAGGPSIGVWARAIVDIDFHDMMQTKWRHIIDTGFP